MNPEVVEKLQKILALAGNGAATEGEVQAAMLRAKEIAIKHGIDLAALPAREDSKSRLAVNVETNSALKTSTRYVHPYHDWIVRTLEEVFDVKFLLSKSRIGSHPYWHRIYIIGEETDILLAVGMFPWLEKMFPKIYGEAVKQGRLQKNFADANGCYYGLFQGISEKNKKQEEEAPQSWALVVRSKEDAIAEHVAKEFPQMRKSKPSHKQFSHRGMQYGEERGKQINLNQMK